MTEQCEKCKIDLEDLGTAGFSIDLKDGSVEYHNRHDRRCPQCGTRYDVFDCKCNKGHCVNNEKHHARHTKSHFISLRK